MGVIIVIGLPGAGKTSVIGDLKGDFVTENLGDMMGEIAKGRGHAKDKDRLRSLGKREYAQDIDAAFKEVSKIRRNMVLTTHVAGENEGRFLPSLKPRDLTLLKTIKALIFITAPTRDIMERRRNDKSRKRAIEPKGIIDAHRMVTLSTMSYYASFINIPLYIIDNAEGRLEHARKQFREIVGKTFGEK